MIRCAAFFLMKNIKHEKKHVEGHKHMQTRQAGPKSVKSVSKNFLIVVHGFYFQLRI